MEMLKTIVDILRPGLPTIAVVIFGVVLLIGVKSSWIGATKVRRTRT